MKKTLILSFVMMAAVALNAQTWSPDKAHAKLGFSVTHLLVSDVEGKFKNFDVTVVSAKDDFTDAQVTVTGDINSINTENDYRDNDLKSDKFFDAQKFPTLTFKSTGIKKKSTLKITSSVVTLPCMALPNLLCWIWY